MQDAFIHKFKDYGASWRVMRPTAITDQIYIKAQRIRSVQEKRENKVGEALKYEFIGIVNYAIMGLVQLEKGYTDQPTEDKDLLLQWYGEYAAKAKELMFSKTMTMVRRGVVCVSPALPISSFKRYLGLSR